MAKGSGGGARGALAKHGGAVSMSIEGLDAVQDMLRDVAPREAKNLLRSTVHAVAGEVRKDMRKRAPKDEGTLRKAIVTKRDKPRGNRVSSSVVITHGKGTKNDAWYWHMVEWGTTEHPAQPFLTPAVEAMRPQILGIYKREFGKKYEALLKRRAKKAAKR
jgi:HK97 gp10 family phage protein